MASISRMFRLLRLSTPKTTFCRTITSQKVKHQSLLIPQIQTQTVPYLLNNNSWIYRQNDTIQTPVINKIHHIELPNGLKWVPPSMEDPTVTNKKEIEMPPSTIESPMETARMIVIRRKKMKKHKLKKLRIRMKFEWAKRRQKRELKKEKAFQAILIQQCKEAEMFSAEKYVEERLEKFNKVPPPKIDWKWQAP